jgi:hypothetical protein
MSAYESLPLFFSSFPVEFAAIFAARKCFVKSNRLCKAFEIPGNESYIDAAMTRGEHDAAYGCLSTGYIPAAIAAAPSMAARAFWMM